VSLSLPEYERGLRFRFPHPREADEDGFLIAGGELSPLMLLSAYEQGIFPWFNPGDPVLWWSPDPRFVLEPGSLHAGNRLRRQLRQAGFTYTLDTDFSSVIASCAGALRKGQPGTWITDSMIRAYTELHRLGFAHSVEVRREGALAGGLYGLSLGSCFFGESMFSLETGASKGAFIALASLLFREGFVMVDCQLRTPHLEALGAREIPRERFLDLLGQGMKAPTLRGNWGERFSPELPF